MRAFLREYWLPGFFFAASIVTTTAAGARFMQNFAERMPALVREADLWPWEWLGAHPERLATGLAFSTSLLAILLVHEFGHYVACRLHGIRATLPIVLPAPTLSGTAGAVIRLRSPIPSRNALMDVAIYGPLAGYIASALAVAAGFLLSGPARGAAPDALVHFGGQPATIRVIHGLLALWRPGLPPFERISPHPVLIAGWIGLFITALNLIPGGQLDGGHILYAMSPRLHRGMKWVLPAALLGCGLLYWTGWILWGLILLIPAMRHPRVPAERGLAGGRWILGLIGIALLALTFTPTPFSDSSLLGLFGGGRF